MTSNLSQNNTTFLDLVIYRPTGHTHTSYFGNVTLFSHITGSYLGFPQNTTITIFSSTKVV